MQASVIGRRGLLLVLSSPSGAGKTVISRALLEQDGMLTMSVSATTRPMRPGEEDGVDYDFIDDEAFARMVERDAFLEHADVFEYRYGTPREPVERALAAGRDVLFDVDWQGAQQLAQRAGDDLVSIFILPPSAGVLERRLKARAQDSDEVVAGRMARARAVADVLSRDRRQFARTGLQDTVRPAYSHREPWPAIRPFSPPPVVSRGTEDQRNP